MARPTHRVRAKAKAMPATRPPLKRMMVLHQRLLAGDYPNCRQLAEELEVSQKTIQRDIEFIRDQFGHSIRYDAAHRGFHYADPPETFPSIEVTSGELIALFVAQKALLETEGSVYGKQLATAFRKLSERAQDKITFSWSEVEGAISFHRVGTAAADLRIFEAVSEAVMRSRELTFDYRNLEGESFVRRRLQPYHLGSIENEWYVIGFDLDRQQLRTFSLSRMRRPHATKARFQRPADFSIEKHLGGSFGVFAGGANRYVVRVEFDVVASKLVAERQWHPSQRVEERADGCVELSMELCSLREIERWILSWGGRARVLSPPELVARLRKTIAAMARVYE